MLLLSYATGYFVLNTFFGLIFLAWYINRAWGRHPEADFAGSNYWGVTVAFSVIVLLCYAAFGGGHYDSGFAVGLVTRLWMTGLGLPFSLVILMIFGPVWNGLNDRKRAREATQ